MPGEIPKTSNINVDEPISGAAAPSQNVDAAPELRRGHRIRKGNVISAVFTARNGGRFANPDERAFLPAALEVIETPASPTLRITAFGICALLTAVLLWSCLARVDMVAVATGKVIPLGQVKVVQPLETSAIRSIFVDDGDHVAAGQMLVELDPTDVTADLGALTYDRGQAALDAEVARVLSTRDPDARFETPDGVDEVLAEANHAQARSEIGKHLAQVEGIEAELAQKQASMEANGVTIDRATATLPLLEEKNATAKILYDKRFGTRPPVLDSEQQLIEKRAELSAAQAATRQIGAEMAAAKAKRTETIASFMADASDRRTKALQKLSGLDRQVDKARQRERYRRLLSAVDGTVQSVKIHTPGAVVTTADTLMTIVPDGTGIEVEANVENKDIGFVREGQDAEIKIDAFPFTRYGLIKGNVRKLGRDAVPATPSQQNTSTAARDTQAQGAASSELGYPAKITLAQDWIAVDDARERLQPGMRISAEIKTGRRRVIEYVLSPVMQAVSEAGRER